MRASPRPCSRTRGALTFILWNTMTLVRAALNPWPGSRGQRITLGLVSTQHPALEAKERLKPRISEATRFIPLERIGLSPPCGFASTWEGNPLTMADQTQ